MNLPNKLTLLRICLIPVFVILMLSQVSNFFLISCIIFIIASITDFLDGKIARKYNLVTDFGKVMDAVADKILVNGVLIALACNGFISVIIPVVIVSRDIFVDSIKMVVGNKVGAVGASKTGKIKTVFMMTGVTLMLFYNLPFEIWGLKVADLLIMIATVLSVVSGVEYYVNNKKYILEN